MKSILSKLALILLCLGALVVMVSGPDDSIHLTPNRYGYYGSHSNGVEAARAVNKLRRAASGKIWDWSKPSPLQRRYEAQRARNRAWLKAYQDENGGKYPPVGWLDEREENYRKSQPSW